MKKTAKFNRSSTAQLLQLSHSLESAFGVGEMPSKGKSNRLGWTSEQLLNLSAAKSLFH
ncbi:MAG: hypothetical protein WBB01_07090 [Phormidesmis sp.]